MRLPLTALGLLVGSLLGPDPALAQETGHEPPAEAMTLFESAREHYRNGRYQEAADDLERALVLDPAAPTLLFNLGRVYELMGDYDRSISTYERLLAVMGPDAEEREQTETTLARLRGARERATPPPTVEEVGTMDEGPTFVRERGVADEAFWGVLIGGGALALLAGGLAIGALVQDWNVDNWILSANHTIEDRRTAYDVAAGLALGADIVGAVAGATLATSVVLFIARERTYEVWPASAELRVGPGSIAGAIRW